ncbi:MAG TPA: hypothetical protein VF195_01785 [Actinomycetota bacterium]
MRRLIATILTISFALLTGHPATAVPPRVSVSAELRCLEGGGIGIDLTIENTGRRIARIDPDFHLLVQTIRKGRQPGVVLFVFPAPGFDRIPPGESRTFLLTAGEPFEGEPAIDFSGPRIILETEVWLRGRDNPVVRTLTYPGCAPIGRQ